MAILLPVTFLLLQEIGVYVLIWVTSTSTNISISAAISPRGLEIPLTIPVTFPVLTETACGFPIGLFTFHLL